MDASLHDDEVVADSEDEENSFGLLMNPDASAVQTTFPDITNSIRTSGISEILSFTDNPSAPLTSISSSLSCLRPSSPVTILKDAISSSSTSGPPPRPKPRPAYKKKDKPENIDSSNKLPSQVQAIGASNFSNFNMDMPSSIADRAKMRSRNAKPHAADAIRTVSETRGRNSNMTLLSNDVIELSSDEDELALLPSTKSVSERKRKTKSKDITISSSDSPLSSAPESDPQHSRPKLKAKKRNKVAHPISSYKSISQHTATSSLHDSMLSIPFHLLSSQLPPSDPPTSTATTCDLPPIETLPNLDTDPLSSPSSLFNAPISARRKRKRVMSDVDELNSDDHQGSGIDMDVDTHLMPPPPLPRLSPAKPSLVDSTLHASPAELVDLSTLPSTIDTSLDSAEPTKKPKTAKPRKKKGQEDLAANGESEKVKPKRKVKEKKQKKKLEVVIQMPKGKGKEKEVFKSREFIEDDEEDAGLVGKKTACNKPSSMTSLSSLPGSDGDDSLVGTSKKRKSSVERSAKDVPTDEEDDAPKRSTATAKRQSKVQSKDEDKRPIPISSLEEVYQPSNVKGMNKGKQRSTETRNSSSRDSERTDTDNRNVDDTGPPKTPKNIQAVPAPETSTKPNNPTESLFSSLSSQYTIAPKTKRIPMSDLIRRVNSLPGSSFSTPQPRGSRLSIPGTAYSPYLKSSRSMLSRIAPLHPNRRTPPPPLPPPPPPKKSKKEKEREEQWEEELIESVGGITEWACMTDAERKEMRTVKRQREMAGWEE